MSVGNIGARARQWQPSPLINATFYLHGVMLVVLVAYPQAWLSILLLLCANHLVVAMVGLYPRSTWLGPNCTQLPPASAARGEIALTIDDGPDPEVTPVVLKMLDQYGIKASFFCIGAAAARYPELCKSIIEHGHAIENHTQHHPLYFAFLGLGRLKREILLAQDTLSEISGQSPRFFRAPAGLRSPLLDPVLEKLGLRLVAWTRRGFDTRTADPAIVSGRLLKNLKPGAILLLHDGNSARSPSGVPVINVVLPVLIEAATAAGLHFVTLSRALDYEN